MTSSNLCPGLFQKAVCSYAKSFDYSVKYCMCIIKSFDYCTTTVQGPHPMPNLPRLLYPNIIFHHRRYFTYGCASFIFSSAHG